MCLRQRLAKGWGIWGQTPGLYVGVSLNSMSGTPGCHCTRTHLRGASYFVHFSLVFLLWKIPSRRWQSVLRIGCLFRLAQRSQSSATAFHFSFILSFLIHSRVCCNCVLTSLAFKTFPLRQRHIGLRLAIQNVIIFMFTIYISTYLLITDFSLYLLRYLNILKSE